LRFGMSDMNRVPVVRQARDGQKSPEAVGPLGGDPTQLTEREPKAGSSMERLQRTGGGLYGIDQYCSLPALANSNYSVELGTGPRSRVTINHGRAWATATRSDDFVLSIWMNSARRLTRSTHQRHCVILHLVQSPRANRKSFGA
jgi:hypothetical protein